MSRQLPSYPPVDEIPLPSLLDPFLRADEALIRLDERAKQSGLRQAWAGRLLYRTVCAGLINRGSLVHLEDLVLLDGLAFQGQMYLDLADALQTLKLWQKALAGRASHLLGAPMPGEEPRALMAENGTDGATPHPDAFYDADFAQGERLCRWREVWRSTNALPPLLAAAVGWDAWHVLDPEPQGCWRSTLLAALILRARGKVHDWLLPIDSGERLARAQWQSTAIREQRLARFMATASAAVKLAGHELDGLKSAEARMTLMIRSASKSSRLPLLRDLLIAKPLVSIPLAAKALGVSKQAVRLMLPQLGSTPREITDRRRYRCWTVP